MNIVGMATGCNELCLYISALQETFQIENGVIYKTVEGR